jgi:hypothetical protein
MFKDKDKFARQTQKSLKEMTSGLDYNRKRVSEKFICNRELDVRAKRRFLLKQESVVDTLFKSIDEDDEAVNNNDELHAIVAECKRTGKKFVDKDFPAEAISLFKDPNQQTSNPATFCLPYLA